MTTPRLILVSLFLAVGSSSLSAQAQPSANPSARAAYDRAMTLMEGKEKSADQALAALFEALEADINLLAAHEAIGKVQEDLRLAAFRNRELQPQADAAGKATVAAQPPAKEPEPAAQPSQPEPPKAEAANMLFQ